MELGASSWNVCNTFWCPVNVNVNLFGMGSPWKPQTKMLVTTVATHGILDFFGSKNRSQLVSFFK
jgi:hypothetical protein